MLVEEHPNNLRFGEMGIWNPRCPVSLETINIQTIKKIAERKKMALKEDWNSVCLIRDS